MIPFVKCNISWMLLISFPITCEGCEKQLQSRKWHPLQNQLCLPRPNSSVFSVYCTYTSSIHWHTLIQYTGPLVYTLYWHTLHWVQCMHGVHCQCTWSVYTNYTGIWSGIPREGFMGIALPLGELPRPKCSVAWMHTASAHWDTVMIYKWATLLPTLLYTGAQCTNFLPSALSKELQCTPVYTELGSGMTPNQVIKDLSA